MQYVILSSLKMQMQIHTVQCLDSTRQSRGWMAQGSHSFTCHPHIYPRMEWAILYAFRKHSPDGVARARWRTSGSAYYSTNDPERIKGWVGLVGWPYSGWFTHISGHPSATGRAWDRESSQVKDRHSITEPRSQLSYNQSTVIHQQRQQHSKCWTDDGPVFLSF